MFIGTPSGVGAPTPALTVYQGPFASNVAGVFAAITNHIQATGITIASAVTFGNIYLTVNTTEASSAVYGAALINIDGTAVCSTTTGVQLGANNTTTVFPCSQSTVSIVPGNYILLTTSSSTVGKYNGTGASTYPTFFTSANVTGCTATAGVFSFSSPCAISIAYTASNAQGIPNFLLH